VVTRRCYGHDIGMEARGGKQWSRPDRVVDVSPSVAVGMGMCDDGSAGDEVSLSSNRGGPWGALGLGQIDRAEVG
jgi:hypothetical protein